MGNWRLDMTLAVDRAKNLNTNKDWAYAQADRSRRWAHSHFVGFVMRRLISTVIAQLVQQSSGEMQGWWSKGLISNPARFRVQVARYQKAGNKGI